ncbi:MAG: tRNA threonylcarbamoyladenosine dehydratase [Campylobacter sp.]|nr:tRNA threonylcarbamoyladenosine dehydratase [Campylobacter sp.]
MDTLDRYTKIRWLLGENFQKLRDAKVLVCGCGGVGGACIEVLYRSGVTNLTIIDNDVFEITNQNRQIGSERLGAKKVDVFKEKFPGIKTLFLHIDEEFISNYNFLEFDFVIDSIDDAKAKVGLANKLATNKTNKPKFVSSMGAAKRLNPELIQITNIWNVSGDPFARKIKYELKKSGFKGNFDVVYSKEEPISKTMGSFMGVTASFGNFLASYVIRGLIKSS